MENKNNLPHWFTEELHNIKGLIQTYNWYKYGKITALEFKSILDFICNNLHKLDTNPTRQAGVSK